MTELFKELIGVYKEKTKLPIVSTYIILLIVWNWDILSIYLFSSVNMETRICWIKNIVPSVWDHLSRVLFPVIISFSYPFITNKLMYYTDKWLNSSITDRLEILNKRRINIAKASFKIKEAELGTSDLNQLEAQILELEAKRTSLTSSLESANKQNEELNGKIEASGVLYEAMKSELDSLRMDSRELSKIKEFLPNYVELIEMNKEVLANERDHLVYEDNVNNLTEKYFLLMNRWDENKVQFFINIKRGDIIIGKNLEQFSIDEIQQFIKDDIITKNNGMYVVTPFGDNFTRKLGIKKRR